MLAQQRRLFLLAWCRRVPSCFNLFSLPFFLAHPTLPARHRRFCIPCRHVAVSLLDAMVALDTKLVIAAPSHGSILPAPDPILPLLESTPNPVSVDLLEQRALAAAWTILPSLAVADPPQPFGWSQLPQHRAWEPQLDPLGPFTCLCLDGSCALALWNSCPSCSHPAVT